MTMTLGKCLQTPVQEPALVWPLKKSKKFLVVSAHPRRSGIAVVDEKPAGATANGNLASVCRTWGESLCVTAVFHNVSTRTWWIPIGANRENPRAYVRLVGGSAPEITLIECAPLPCLRMRLSTEGVFTKRRNLDFVLPHQMTGTEAMTLLDILPSMVAPEPLPALTVFPATESPSEMLPFFQREGRDRLSRRLKTLRKSLVNQEQHQPEALELDQARIHAFDMQSQGKGREMDAAFKELKRLGKAEVDSSRQVAKVREAVALAEADLARLRDGVLTEDDVATILARHGIKSGARATTPKASQPVASDWYDFILPDGTRMMVGKGAGESDRLVKSSAANDWWIHAVGVTGSHVIVPGRQFKGMTELPAHVVRAAGILAVHYSKFRENRAGEVYVTRKANLRKRKGDPAGLWQVERSSSMMIRFNADDLAALFRNQTAKV